MLRPYLYCQAVANKRFIMSGSIMILMYNNVKGYVVIRTNYLSDYISLLTLHGCIKNVRLHGLTTDIYTPLNVCTTCLAWFMSTLIFQQIIAIFYPGIFSNW